jgi:hypothetical protein
MLNADVSLSFEKRKKRTSGRGSAMVWDIKRALRIHRALADQLNIFK